MAPTFVHGKSGFFSVSDTAGTTRNLSSGLDSASIDRSADTAEVTSFGDSDRAYIAGLRGATISLSGTFASTYAIRLDGMLGNSTLSNWVYGPEGNTGGSRKYSGTGNVTSVSYSGSVDGKIDMSIDIQVSGAVTAGTF